MTSFIPGCIGALTKPHQQFWLFRVFWKQNGKLYSMYNMLLSLRV